MKGYEVWGRIEEGCSEVLGLFTEFRKAEREAKQASTRYPLGADIDCCVIDVWGDYDKIRCEQLSLTDKGKVEHYGFPCPIEEVTSLTYPMPF